MFRWVVERALVVVVNAWEFVQFSLPSLLLPLLFCTTPFSFPPLLQCFRSPLCFLCVSPSSSPPSRNTKNCFWAAASLPANALLSHFLSPRQRSLLFGCVLTLFPLPSLGPSRKKRERRGTTAKGLSTTLFLFAVLAKTSSLLLLFLLLLSTSPLFPTACLTLLRRRRQLRDLNFNPSLLFSLSPRLVFLVVGKRGREGKKIGKEDGKVRKGNKSPWKPKRKREQWEKRSSSLLPFSSPHVENRSCRHFFKLAVEILD